MTELQLALSVASGAVVGFALGLLGGGGSVLAVPLLLYVVGIHDAHVVIGSTAMAVAVNAYFNLIPHAKAGHVRWQPALWFAAFGVAGAALGSRAGQLIPSKYLLFLFAIFMLMMAYRMVKGRSSEASVDSKRPINYRRLGTTALGVGLLSGFFGIGGGFLIVPGLIFSAGLSMVEAVGTSLFSVGTFGLTTAVSYSLAGLVDWGIVIPFILGGAAGGILGALFAARLGRQKRTLQYVFSGVIVMVALYMLVMNFDALYGHIT